MTYFDWDDSFPPKRVALYSYFERYHGYKKVYRKRRFDRIVNNPVFAYKSIYYFSILAAVTLLIFLDLGGFFHIRPTKSLFDFTTEPASQLIYSKFLL